MRETANGAHHPQQPPSHGQHQIQPPPPPAAAQIVLPRVDHNMVPVREVIGRMIQQSYAELQTMVETLPNTDDMERKATILKYSTRTRQQFIKLLVLVRWSKNAESIQKLQDIIAFLDHQDNCFRDAADFLAIIHEETKRARDPNFDIPTAVDILTTGKYERLPTVIKKSIIPPAPLTQPEIKETIKKTEEIMRMRVLVDEVIPQPFRENMRIENGCTIFRIEDELEVALTLDGSDKSLRRWLIVELKILVKWNQLDYEGLAFGRSLDHLINRYQQGSAAYKNIRFVTLSSPAPPNCAPQPHPLLKRFNRQISLLRPMVQLPPKEGKQWPLVSLYRYLHDFCLHYRVEILRAQAAYLAQTRWRDQLKVDFACNPAPVVTIRYWNKLPGQSLGNSNVLVIGRFVELSLERVQSRTTSSDFSSLRIPAGIDVAVAKSLSKLSNEEEYQELVVRCYTVPISLPSGLMGQQQPLVDATTGRPVKLSLSTSSLDVEKILVEVTRIEARGKLKALADMLAGFPLSDFWDGDAGLGGEPKMLMDVDQDGMKQDDAAPSAELPGNGMVGGINPSFALSYRPSRKIKLSVDTHTGLIGVTQIGSAQSSSMAEKLRLVEMRLNTEPHDCIKAMLFIRRASMIDEVDAFSQVLKLSPIRMLPLSYEQLSRLCSPVPDHFTYLHDASFGSHYIALATGVHSKFISQDGYGAADSIEDMKNEPAFRIWVISVSSTPGANSLVLDNIIPISTDILEADQESGLKESSLIWTTLNMSMMHAITAHCRNHIAWAQLTSQLRKSGLQYTFLKRVLSAESESEGALGSLLLISPDSILRNPTRTVLNNPAFSASATPAATPASLLPNFPLMAPLGMGHVPTAQPTRSEPGGLPLDLIVDEYPFGSFYVTLQKRSMLEHDMGKNEAASVNDDGMTGDTVVGKARLQLNRLPPVTQQVLAKWKQVAALAQIASALHLRREWMLAEGGWAVVAYDLTSITLACNVEQEGGLPTVSITRVAGMERFKIEFSNAEDPAVTSLVAPLESVLNDTLDVVLFIKTLSRILRVVFELIGLRNKLNVPENFIYPETPLVRLEVLSCTFVRLIHGHHGLDFEMVGNDQIAVFDASPNTVAAAQLIQIPHFSDFPDPGPLFTSMVTHLLKILDDASCPDDATLTRIPMGAIFSDSLLPLVAARLASVHLDTLSQIAWVAERARQLAPQVKMQLSVPAQHIVIQTPMLICGWKVGVVEPAWKLGLAITPNQPAQDPMHPGSTYKASKESLNVLASYFNEKVSSLQQQGVNLRPFLKVLLEYMTLPQELMHDFAQFPSLELVPPGKTKPARFEWCLAMPEHSEQGLPPLGAPGFIVERERTRICLVFKFTSLLNDETRILAIRYNYATKVVWAWQAAADALLSDTDMTEMPAGPFLQGKLQEMDSNLKQFPNVNRLFIRISRLEGTTKLSMLVRQLLAQPNIMGLPAAERVVEQR
ncbi:mediator complex subunit MED14-domain-containing protein [Zopfochytrium polystomum]|nr:mediator complex subunit MED14-domain-containing protein [Zopfochytrium polystomum]